MSHRTRIASPHLALFSSIVAVSMVLTGCASNVEVGGRRHHDRGPHSASSVFTGVPLVPLGGTYLGIYYGSGTPADTEDALGGTPRIDLTYFGWKDAWSTAPVLAADSQRGQISLVNWEPFDVDFRDIVAGRYDDLLALRGTEAARLSAPVFLDFAAEMNEEEGWGGHDPELYIAAYRHVHDIIAPLAGEKVVWVWAPNNVDSENAPPAIDYYPGDEYVDWTGIDGYNWGTSEPGFAWQSFEEVFADVYDDLHAIGKPILIAETGSAEDGGSKAEWIRAIPATLRTRFPDIKGVVWFDVEKERDWRFASSGDARTATRELVADPVFVTR